MKGANERYLYEILNDAFPGKWVSEFKGITGRKFRFDAANPTEKICIEVEGGIWISGRHNRPIGMQQDLEKYNLAVLEGWKILRYTPEQMKKTPWKLISDIRKLCGVDESQKELDLTGYKQSKLDMVQVRIQ